MLPGNFINQTIERFPGYAAEDFKVCALEKGGSDRKFYRIRSEDRSMIVVKYSGQREENRHYVDIAQFLAGAGVSVPRIYFHDPVEGLIWMQDLGEEDLWAFRQAPWELRRPLYESALSEVSKLHAAAGLRLEISQLRLEREFGEQLYFWEQNYFFEHCLQAHFGVEEKAARRYAKLAALQNVATRLGQLPRVLVHRDFQSQNVLIREEAAWLIDFQGMRPGLAQYDVASLLFDPYVELTAAERDFLLRHYQLAARGAGLTVGDDFEEIFYLCALQRLMQAMGAYGFLGIQKGRSDFLAHIPAARRSLREVAARIDGLDELVELLDLLP